MEAHFVKKSDVLHSVVRLASVLVQMNISLVSSRCSAAPAQTYRAADSFVRRHLWARFGRSLQLSTSATIRNDCKNIQDRQLRASAQDARRRSDAPLGHSIFAVDLRLRNLSATSQEFCLVPSRQWSWWSGNTSIVMGHPTVEDIMPYKNSMWTQAVGTL